MKINQRMKLAAAISAGLALAGCGALDDDDNSSSSNSKELTKAFNCTDVTTSGARVICIGSADDLSDEAVQEELLSAVANAETGDTIVLPTGRYNLNQTVTFTGTNASTLEPVSDLTFRGAGMDQTILDVSGAPSDGFSFENTNMLTFEDFGVYESNNNAIIVKKGNGIIFRRMATVWETDFQATNGAYGIYPVESSNILVEDSFVQGSADAGVYVGQSDAIVVRNNQAIKNVAGIEIENSTNADVYGNVATGNTGGILVFDLPINNGTKYGSGVRVFDNIVKENNAPNFAKVGSNPGGVHIVPPGTGVIVLSTSDVEIFNNTITDHQTMAVAVTSFMLADSKVADAPNTTTATSYGEIQQYALNYMNGWSPFVRGINIHDNVITNAEGINNPQGSLIEDIIAGYKQFQLLTASLPENGNAELPDILYDGVGELMVSTDSPVPAHGGATFLQAIAGGINQVAAGLHGAGAEDTLKQINMANFVAYEDTGAHRVCESNNGEDTTSASVFPRKDPGDYSSFDSTTFEPKTNLELRSPTVLDDNSMDCSDISGEAFIGTPSVVTFGTDTYGCETDDTTSEFCKG